jgi:hypothetical protein
VLIGEKLDAEQPVMTPRYARVKHRALFAWAAAAALATAGAARADDAPPPPTVSVPGAPAQGAPPPAPAPATPAELLAAADAAVDAGNLEAAAPIYDRLAREHAASPEAGEARRALKIIAARKPAARQAAATDEPQAATADTVVTRREPYSLRTSERLRLSAWEKLDFGTSAFLYGMSVGFSYSLSSDSNDSDDILPAVAVGAIAYTLGSVAYLQAGKPDRGDLPLVLAISSYVPTTTLLVSSVARENPDPENTALAVVGSGLLAIPAAVLIAREVELDPGDTQLVRDAGFWGLVLGTTGALAFGGETRSIYGFEQYVSPSNRKIAAISLAGLYGGLALGTIAAMNSEVSLERVRVTTWGGYGGTVVGLLLGGASANSDRGAFTGMTIGGAVGLLITFLATSGLDGIPPDDASTTTARRAAPRWTPSLMPIVGVDGQSRTGIGITGAAF